MLTRCLFDEKQKLAVHIRLQISINRYELNVFEKNVCVILCSMHIAFFLIEHNVIKVHIRQETEDKSAYQTTDKHKLL